jgi:hypothetical protein
MGMPVEDLLLETLCSRGVLLRLDRPMRRTELRHGHYVRQRKPDDYGSNRGSREGQSQARVVCHTGTLTPSANPGQVPRQCNSVISGAYQCPGIRGRLPVLSPSDPSDIMSPSANDGLGGQRHRHSSDQGSELFVAAGAA